jgi:signal peptidase
MKEKIKKCYHILKKIVSGLILMCAILLIGARLIGLTPYVVLSGSMAPTYPVGSLIYVQKVEPNEIEVGDPITFVLNEDLVVATHRVVDIDDTHTYFYTKGDANDVADSSPVHYKNLIGKPLFMLPKLGYVVTFLSTQHGMVIGALALCCLFLFIFFPERAREMQEEETSDVTLPS